MDLRCSGVSLIGMFEVSEMVSPARRDQCMKGLGIQLAVGLLLLATQALGQLETVVFEDVNVLPMDEERLQIERA